MWFRTPNIYQEGFREKELNWCPLPPFAPPPIISPIGFLFQRTKYFKQIYIISQELFTYPMGATHASLQVRQKHRLSPAPQSRKSLLHHQCNSGQLLQQTNNSDSSAILSHNAQCLTYFLTFLVGCIRMVTSLSPSFSPSLSPSLNSPSSHPIILLHHKKGRSNIRNQFSQTILLILVGKYRCTFDVWKSSDNFLPSFSFHNFDYFWCSQNHLDQCYLSLPLQFMCLAKSLFFSQLIENTSWKQK